MNDGTKRASALLLTIVLAGAICLGLRNRNQNNGIEVTTASPTGDAFLDELIKMTIPTTPTNGPESALSEETKGSGVLKANLEVVEKKY